jgi:hypothetical protein
MLFLLNDVILNLGAGVTPPPLDRRAMDALSFNHVVTLAQEMFAADPLLHRNEPERAARLALLIATKQPQVNAALFVAPAQGCSPQAVTARYAGLTIEAMANLYTEHKAGRLTPAVADSHVWRRMAA